MSKQKDNRTLGELVDAIIASEKEQNRLLRQCADLQERVIGSYLARTHVVRTRYVRPTGKVVNHVYGPYTPAKARTERRRMLAEAKDEGYQDQVECSVHQVIDIDAMNNQSKEGGQ